MTREHRRSSSALSDEQTSVAVPLAVARSTRRWMSALEPTSTPCVGSSAGVERSYRRRRHRREPTEVRDVSATAAPLRHPRRRRPTMLRLPPGRPPRTVRRLRPRHQSRRTPRPWTALSALLGARPGELAPMRALRKGRPQGRNDGRNPSRGVLLRPARRALHGVRTRQRHPAPQNPASGLRSLPDTHPHRLQHLRTTSSAVQGRDRSAVRGCAHDTPPSGVSAAALGPRRVTAPAARDASTATPESRGRADGAGRYGPVTRSRRSPR